MNKLYESELNFWDEQLSGKGVHSIPVMKRFTAGQMSDEFPKFIIGILEKQKADNKKLPKVIDIGSGPVSQLVWGHEVRIMRLWCADPLAKEYKKLHKKYKITIKYILNDSPGEELKFDNDNFDLVWIHNSLDHSRDPLKVFEEAKRVLSPGGFIIFQGWENEGKHNGYFGLHSHDIYWNERLCVKTHGENIKKQFDISGLEVKETYFPIFEKEGRKWLKVIFQKNR